MSATSDPAAWPLGPSRLQARPVGHSPDSLYGGSLTREFLATLRFSDVQMPCATTVGMALTCFELLELVDVGVIYFTSIRK